jgi:hypothetical protein
MNLEALSYDLTTGHPANNAHDDTSTNSGYNRDLSASLAGVSAGTRSDWAPRSLGASARRTNDTSISPHHIGSAVIAMPYGQRRRRDDR